MAKQPARAAFGWVDPLGTFLAVVDTGIARTGGLGAPAASLSPSPGDHQLMLIRCRVFSFKSSREKSPLISGRDKITFFY